MANTAKSSAPAIVQKLVETFEQNLDSYRSTKNETELRREFLDKFFTALGWDVANEKAYDEQGKEVVHEFSVEISGQQKKADYAFRVGRGDKFDFLVEAKKPSVKIESNQDAAFQIRRYGWSAKLPINILTDFEHFAVYDCRAKPSYNDKAATGRILLIHYKEYVERWGEIASIFSPEAVRQGSFVKYAEGTKKKRGTADVDDAFLQEIERWRELLAKNIALRNEDIDIAGLNYAVQMTIDRIVFLRICEERGIEAENQLLDISNSGDVYRELGELFKRADTKYNSGLFHFKQEKEQASRADDLTLGLDIDDKVLKDIISNLYYPKSPYAFLYIPADILGQVYERFLGKVIRLTAGHNAKVEEKPEVRKAGGVYYTPTYIVDYIVKNTVGKLVEEEGRLTAKNAKSAKELINLSGLSGSKGLTPTEVAKLKIVDPACGSGTFLLGAYQFLLDWHLNWYVNDDAEKWEKSKAIWKVESGYKLTTSKKKEILLNNIHGVDIDAQAVEVTKLSLLLKVLENASGQLGLGMERVLPDLGNNIKCGNSLIGFDYFEGQLLPDEEERARVNPFDWKNEFPQVFRSSPNLGEAGRGFDAVIGNPPYIDIKSLPNNDVRYLFHRYYSANNRINMFAVFIEKVLEIINQKSFRFSMIVPTALLTQDSYKKLRQTILNNYQVDNVARLPNESFGGSAGDVKVDTAIFVLSNQGKEQGRVEIIAYEGYNRIDAIDANTAKIHGFANQQEWKENQDSIWSINLFNNEDAVIRKIETVSVPLEECASFSLGLTPYDKYKGHTQTQIKNQVFHANHQKDETFRKLLAGNDVRRYSVHWNGEVWISYGNWLGAPREKRFFTQKRILVKQIIDWTTKRIWATITSEELYNTQNAFNLLTKNELSLEYLLGTLNSKLMTFYHQKKYLDEFKMRFQKILIKDAKRFPIRTINFSDPAEKAQHDKMVSLVEAMLALHKSLALAQSPAKKERLERQIQVTDKAIDGLVYELYGLTEEEIRIVEGE